MYFTGTPKITIVDETAMEENRFGKVIVNLSFFYIKKL